IVCILQSDALFNERQRLGGKWLGRIGLLSRNVTIRRNGTLNNWPHGLPGDAIEDERVPSLRHLSHSIDALPLYCDGPEVRLSCEIPVPEAVMYRLEIPLQLSRRGVKAY